MKLIIFGSTGGTGLQVVTQALDEGHQVTAFTRSPDKLGPNRDNLHVVRGDVLDPVAVERAIQDHDAVLCTLGMPLMNKDMLRTTGTQNIIRGMKKAGVKRLVCQSSLGVGDSRDTAPFCYKYVIFPLILRHVLADHERQESHIKNSPLDWIIVQPGNLTEDAPTDSYRHGIAALDSSLKIRVSRAEVAGFMLKQLADDTYLHQTPWISS